MNEGFSYEKFFSEKEETPPPKKLKGILSLLKESFRFYFSNFKFIMGVLGLPLGFFLLLFNISYISNFTSLEYSLFLPVFKFVFAIFSSLLLLTSSLALIQGFGEEISVRDAYKKGWRLLPAYLWLLLILALIEIGGFILGFIPGIVFQIWFSLAVFIFLFENLKGLQALLRSKQLVKGKFWAVFLRFLILAIILGAISTGLRFLATSKIDYIPLSNFLDTIINVFLQILLLPIFLFYAYLIYRDLKEIKAEEPVMFPSLGMKTFYGIFAFAGAIPLLLFSWLTFTVFYGRDIPGFDDSDLRLTKIEIPKEENAFYDFQELLKNDFLHDPRYSRLYLDMMGGRRLETKEAKEFMEKNEKIFLKLEKTLSHPYFQFPQLQDPEKFEQDLIYKEVYPRLADLRKLAWLGMTRGHYLFAQGKEKEAFQWYINVVKLGKMVENSPRPAGLVQYLDSETIMELGLQPLRDKIGKEHLPPSELKRYAKELEKLGENREGIKRALKMEYIFSCNSQARIVQLLNHKPRNESEEFAQSYLYSMFPLHLLSPCYFKPNKTKFLQAEVIRTMSKNIEKTYKNMNFFPTEAIPSEESKEDGFHPLKIIRYLFWENSIGETLVDFSTSQFLFAEHLCRERFSLEATAVLLALRAYQKEKRKLPDRLNELVPEYLSRLPLDPFDGKPLRYSKEKKIVYCVGKDLVDSGGNREWGSWTNWRDPGFPVNF